MRMTTFLIRLKAFLKKRWKRFLFKSMLYKHEYAVPTPDYKEGLYGEPLLKIYVRTLKKSFENTNVFNDTRIYCMFLGYPRSGHSLVGSLLDAHSNIIIAHEADVLGLIQHGIFSKKQILSFLLESSKRFSEMGRGWSDYSYNVPSQWQGRFKTLKVIGDKKGGITTQRIRNNPALLHKLIKTVDMKVKIIHHIRNPYDIISTFCRRANMEAVTKKAVDYIFSLCATMKYVKSEIDENDIFEQRHEFLIAQPKTYLKQVCDFLEEECPDDYLDSCVSIVRESPHKSRYKVQWSNEMISLVEDRMKEFDFLEGYSFNK